jgi:3-hydroxybutyryl-CoA dehydratase
MKGRTIDTIAVGDSATFTKTISESDIYLYAGVSGDVNPAHLDEEYAKTTMFKTRIAHGMLSAGLISAVMGVQLPGPGSIYLGQTLKFLAPVKIGDTITAKAEVLEVIAEKNRLKMKTTCTNQAGTLVIDGEATIMPPRK